MKKFWRIYGPLILIAGSIITFDQLSKSWVRNNISLGEIWSPIDGLEKYARIVHWNNTGAAFGMFQDLSLVFTVLAFIVSIAIFYYYPRIPREDWPLRLALSLQLGGAVGNLIDRLSIGHVTDFISVGNFAVFNIADASISVGVAVLVVGIWINDRLKPQAADTEGAEESGQEATDKPSENRSEGTAQNHSHLTEEYLGD